MHLRLLLAVCAVATMAASSVATPRQDFNAAYRAYGDAIAEYRYIDAVKHAGETRRLARDVLAGDSPEVAILTFNHGFALGKAGRVREAYRILTEALTLARKAFGEDAMEIIQVEVELAHTGSPAPAIAHLRNALRLAGRHHGEDSEFVADLKVDGATRVWKEGAAELLREAVLVYDRLGNTEKYALAQFWLGKRHLDDARYGEVVEPMTAVVDAEEGSGNLALVARRNLVEAYERLGDRERATEHCLAIGSATPWTGLADFEPVFERATVHPPGKRGKGSVLIRFTVDTEGYVTDPVVVRSQGGSDFEAAALATIDGFRYAPRFLDGEPVPVAGVQQRVVFGARE